MEAAGERPYRYTSAYSLDYISGGRLLVCGGGGTHSSSCDVGRWVDRGAAGYKSSACLVLIGKLCAVRRFVCRDATLEPHAKRNQGQDPAAGS